ncbi:hypothetical protein J3454_07755 [Erythrobacter sp. NFXS35]|uniref:hypothetical protein n=1 Tax=Erythrobacter sp. NFXS35 TaxID=2818436 RepID=UPI0032DEB2F2
MKIPLLVLSAIACASCESDEVTGRPVETDDKTYSEHLKFDHYEACSHAEKLYPDYDLLSDRSAKAYLKYRYEGERVGAFLAYNEYYCALLNRNLQQGAERCVVFTPASVGLGGSVKFCIDKEGVITEFFQAA